MRALLVILLALCGRAAWCEGIVDVLQRSQQQRLEAMSLAEPDSPRAQTVRRSFELVLGTLASKPEVELRVIRGETVAETLQGHVVVANESLADVPEGERLFILAHELGHVVLGHGSQMNLMFQKWVPGSVTPQQTNAVAALLSDDASELAHRQEFEADAFGLHTLHLLGRSGQDAISAFMHLGAHAETATHPGTGRRVAALRAAEAEEENKDAPASQAPK